MNARRGRYGRRDQVTLSIWFDPQRRAATPELQAVVTSLIASLEQHEDALTPRLRARREIDRRSFHLAIECIVCNLAALIVTGLDRSLAVPRSSGVMWAKGRYCVPVYGRHYLTALDLMAQPEVGLIDSLERGYRFTGGNKRRSTIKQRQPL